MKPTLKEFAIHVAQYWESEKTLRIVYNSRTLAITERHREIVDKDLEALHPVMNNFKSSKQIIAQLKKTHD